MLFRSIVYDLGCGDGRFVVTAARQFGARGVGIDIDPDRIHEANDLAKRGYAVLVHDTFTFGSRRVRVGDVPKVIKRDLVEVNPEAESEIAAYEKAHLL